MRARTKAWPAARDRVEPQKNYLLIVRLLSRHRAVPAPAGGAAAAKLGVVGVEERLAARPRRRRRARADEVADLGDDLGGLVLRGGPVLVLLVRVEQRVAEDAAELPRDGGARGVERAAAGAAPPCREPTPPLASRPSSRGQCRGSGGKDASCRPSSSGAPPGGGPSRAATTRPLSSRPPPPPPPSGRRRRASSRAQCCRTARRRCRAHGSA